jgi:hypothetical protein
VFLPRRYGVLFSDEELQRINEKTVSTKPQIPGHQHHHKFLHLGNRIGILVNFQMEPARADTPEALPIDPVDTITRMMLLGLLEHVGELVEKEPYEVVLIDRWGDDIFAVYHKVPVFRILQIPRGCHETFSRFCTRLKENRVEDVYLEFAGRTDDGEPVLKVYGGGFHVCMS